jgi:PAS domain S-box-containing protein
MREQEIDIFKFYFVFDMLQAGVNIIDNNGKIIYVNDEYCKMHHYSKEELIGKSLDMILPNIEGFTSFKKIINKQIQKPYIVESHNIRKDGSKFPVLLSWNYFQKNDEPDGMVTVVQDISKIKEYEKAIKESEEKYRALIENVSDIIWETDNRGKFAYISNKCMSIFGISPKEMLQKNIKDLLNDMREANSLNFLNSLKGKGPIAPIELTLKKNSGDVVVVESSAIPLCDDEGNFTGYRGIYRDITAQKEINKATQEITLLKNRLEKREYLEYIMGDSQKIKVVHNAVEKVAKTDFSVIIYGETGTGKEIVANAIHQFSNRSDKPLVSLDCGAIPENLLESELFGYTKGAFTGSVGSKKGLIEMANGGTLFLDEITNLSFELQKKLLRVFQEREIQRIGSTKKEKLDIRIICACNANILDFIKQGKFREDLYFRLNEFNISIPPLRERYEDMPILIKRFNLEISEQLHIREKTISKEAMEKLMNYEWYGNVRELKNMLKKAIVISDTDVLLPEHFDLIRTPENQDLLSDKPEVDMNDPEKINFKKLVRQQKDSIEKDIINKAMAKFKGNKSKVAKYLDLDYKTLFNKVKEFDL